MKEFWERVNEKAYSNYLNRVNNNKSGSEQQDWENAERDVIIEDKIRDEAFLHYLKHGGDDLSNWDQALHEISYRLNILAYYLHEKNINKTPLENWKEAQKIYIEKY